MSGRTSAFLSLLFLAAALPLSAQNGSARSSAVAAPEIIQLQPSEKELLDEGTQLQQQKNPARALSVFTDLLRYYPDSKNQEEVLFRIAGCYRDMGRFDDATQTLDLLDQKFAKGDWAGPGSLLRGEILAANKKWEESVAPLQRATLAKLPEVQLRARYLLVLGSETLHKLSAARPNLEALVKATQNNPYLDYAQLKLAMVEADGGDKARAAELFKTVLAGAKDGDLRAEAAVRAGNLAYAGKQYRDAVGYYEVVRRTEAPEFWKKLAHLGLVQSYYAVGDYAAVVDVFNSARPLFPDQARAEVFFLAAESLRLTKKEKDALEQYQVVIDQFPQDPLAEAASLQRISILKSSNSDQLIPETTRFIAKYTKSDRLIWVELIRADAYLGKGDSKTAAPMYAEVLKHPESLKDFKANDLANVYYRAGYAYFNTKDYENAVVYLKQFVGLFPGHPATAAVLWLKGQAEWQLKKSDDALQSWGQLIELSPKFEQRELLLWQAALLAGTQKKSDSVEAWLGKLIQEFPKSSHVAEAHAILAGIRQDAKDGALSHWQAARQLDAVRYYGPATQQIIRLLLQKQDLAGLRAELSAYDAWRLKNPTAPGVALEVVEWVGQQLQDGKTAMAEAEPYYRRVLAGSQDRVQRKRVQLRLALLMSAESNHGAAIREWKTYRANFPEDANRSGVLEPLAKACIGAADYDLADKLAQQILEQNPEGEFNARGRLLLGELALAKRDYAGAAKLFSAVALLIDDPVLTPLALSRAQKAWHLAGNEDKADEQLLRLKKQYPDYKVPE